MDNIKISTVKRIREELNLDQMVIFGLDSENRQHVATSGKTNIDARSAAEMGNNMKKVLNWPEKFVHEKPIERKCENCSFWQRKKHDPGYPLPERWAGKCMFNPDPVIRYDEDIACGKFEPNF